MYEALYKTFNELVPLSHEDRISFEPCLSLKTFDKRSYLLKEGDTCEGFYFIISGCARSYFIKEGNELNSGFFLENSFATDMESLTLQQPSRFFIEAMEPVHAIYCDRNKILDLYKRSPVFESLGRILTEKMLVHQQQYAQLFTCYTPRERYLYIVNNHPELLQRLPLQFLASYLGMARETLSRIRGKV